MKKQNVRVIIASEYPDTRYFLSDVVAREDGAVIVGQAENATKALTLARKLRPDVAIIDCYLPYTIGLDSVPLSRIGGLDTAQTISEEIPNIRVIIVNNLDAKALPERGLAPDSVAFFSSERKEANTALTLKELYQETTPLSLPVFANIRTRQRVGRQIVADFSDKALLFGSLVIVAGVFLILTVFLAGTGIFLAVAGAATMFLGLAGKLTTSFWPKIFQPKVQARRG